ncbi:hypothetical protein PMAYCL1PPCAC_24704 [Pristionchus mayeri]|uniref:F-box domain-containing protein n=1 Tax=Pristionchus mayeri TaxID=1317129 RepID=A0AAN5I7N3_9BILA|nr:hypothetical protein PMAYCL1PPCAC_24704 [Pristionchus mayeri]
MDNLCNLPDDCLLDVFTRIDHDDLDELSTISRKMDRLSFVSRPKAVKASATHCTVMQVDQNEFEVEIHVEYETFNLRINKENTQGALFKKYSHEAVSKPIIYRGHTIDTQDPAITEAVLCRISNLLYRFDFDRFDFYSICLDRNFVKFFVEFVSTRSITQFYLHKFKLDRNIERDVLAKFVSAILKAKFAVIYANHVHPVSFFEEQFIRDYSNSVTFPNLTIGYEQMLKDHWPPRITPAKQFVDNILPRFITLDAERLEINSDWIISALLARLRMRESGSWQFSITRIIDCSEIEAMMDLDLNYSPKGDNHIIRIKRTLNWVNVRFSSFCNATFY